MSYPGFIVFLVLSFFLPAQTGPDSENNPLLYYTHLVYVLSSQASQTPDNPDSEVVKETGTSAQNTSRLAGNESLRERLRYAAARHPFLSALAITILILVFVLLRLWWMTGAWYTGRVIDRRPDPCDQEPVQRGLLWRPVALFTRRDHPAGAGRHGHVGDRRDASRGMVSGGSTTDKHRFSRRACGHPAHRGVHLCRLCPYRLPERDAYQFDLFARLPEDLSCLP